LIKKQVEIDGKKVDIKNIFLVYKNNRILSRKILKKKKMKLPFGKSVVFSL
jgi:hypothetical protein